MRRESLRRNEKSLRSARGKRAHESEMYVTDPERSRKEKQGQQKRRPLSLDIIASTKSAKQKRGYLLLMFSGIAAILANPKGAVDWAEKLKQYVQFIA